MKGVGKPKAPPPALAPSGAYNMARFAETSPPDAAPAALDMGQYEDADMPADVPEPEEPGLLEAGARGLKQGVFFGFGDEISGALESAFTNKTYKQARDEARAKDAAAREAHPWGFGLANALGAVGTGLATGGLAAGAAKLGTAGVAALAGGEGALGAIGESEATDVGGLAKDAVVGGATGAVLGAGLHKVLGSYVGGAVERRAQHLTEDIAEGAVPTVKRRLGKVTQPNEAGESMAVDIIDSDPAFLGAIKAGKKEGIAAAKARLNVLGAEVKPAYAAIDEATGGIAFTDVQRAMQSAIDEADLPGNSNIRDALAGTLKDLETSTRRKLARDGVAAAPEVAASPAAKGAAKTAATAAEKAPAPAKPPATSAPMAPGKKLAKEVFASDDDIVRTVHPSDLIDVRDIEGKPIAPTSDVRIQSIRDLFDKPAAELPGGRAGQKPLEQLREPVVSVSPGGRLEIVDGRHRLLVARERGEAIKVRLTPGHAGMDGGTEWAAAYEAHPLPSAAPPSSAARSVPSVGTMATAVERQGGGAAAQRAVRPSIHAGDPGYQRFMEQVHSVRAANDAAATPVAAAAAVPAAAAGDALSAYKMPAQDVRGWVSRLLKRADQSMGSLSETERKVVKDKVHEVAHGFLRGTLDDIAANNAALKPAVETILAANKKIRVFASVKEALEKSAERRHWGPSSLKDALSSAGLPGVAAIIAGGADVASGGAAFAAAKLGQGVAHKLNRAATFHLSKLVRAARAGGVTQAQALEAIKAGVPVATVRGILGPAFQGGGEAAAE